MLAICHPAICHDLESPWPPILFRATTLAHHQKRSGERCGNRTVNTELACAREPAWKSQPIGRTFVHSTSPALVRRRAQPKGNVKIKYTTTRETALVLREMAGNLGSSDRSLLRSGFGRTIERLEAQRARPVEDFMNGIADVSEPTGEAVMRAFENCRRFRTKTISRLAPSIVVTPL